MKRFITLSSVFVAVFAMVLPCLPSEASTMGVTAAGLYAAVGPYGDGRPRGQGPQGVPTAGNIEGGGARAPASTLSLWSRSARQQLARTRRPRGSWTRSLPTARR